ncbi:putative protein kinase RLK-Pelle-CrRLK1L-1 family [Medicago truncatula]|uniref:Protein kinase domain-containing protein n=1 Tax=Medicago truncatula TaxID=3880 RepID=A0A396GVA3_MEDTR|nr:receptor-like protein kinase FERONIA [Medicago truncatula]RHN44453.1 putative protein kinase RLK-Pelle-CrRLK1L-1 family [Medicago truncatula]
MANTINKKNYTKISILSLILLLFPLLATSYNPIYNIAISCGSSTNTTALDSRIWVGDNNDNTKLFTFIEPKTTNPSPKTSLKSPNFTVPYTHARVSFSNFTYSFSSITVSPVFLRLYFYPASYQNFEPSNALFSVKVNNNLTLLQNFNPSLWLHHDENNIIKEYCIQIKTNEKLNITFIPTSNVSYAFINGIEVVSMPSFLYYTNLSDQDYRIKLDGSEDIPYQILNDKALEMVYRVNVGRIQVPPNQDTGMFRNWDNDYPRYLEKQYPLSVSNDYEHHLNYLKNAIPNYTAPEAVYLTARSLEMKLLVSNGFGVSSSWENDFNVTWNFEVDSGFTYMVRLHFCEFDPDITNKGDRVFQIFIDNTLVEEKADVIGWSGARMVPVHKDYAMSMDYQEGSSQLERANLSIKLQPLTEYNGFILNGIEILKISDKNNNLAIAVSTQSSKITKITPLVAIVVVTSVSGLVLAISMGITVFWIIRRCHNVMEDNLLKTKNGESLPPHLCRSFTIAEIKAATNNFDDAFIIGVGGFGNVYKGCVDGSTLVAVKRLKSGSQQGANEFMNEIELLSQLRHIHLVSLVGYCNDDTEMILVYEFMQHGTLCEYLYGSNNEPLPWRQRLEILLGAARGLNYLHAEVKHKIIHRDVKSTNILLDEKWIAKVSDFGLSKVGPTGISTTHISTMVKGSLGYLDPEYYMFQRLTLKSDVYSFGVVLLEVLCARPPLVRNLDKNTASLVCWFKRCYEEGVAIEQIVDPFLRDSITGECLEYYCKLALSCLHDDGIQRPSMSQVVGGLEFALQLVVSEEDYDVCTTQKEITCIKGLRFSQSMSDEGSGMHFARSQTFKESTISARSITKEHLFSEIRNQKRRSYSCQNFKVYI